MKLAAQTVLLLAIFAGVGYLTYHAVIAHSAAQAGAYLPATRLAAMMAGLFAGGAATALTGIALALASRRSGRHA